mgnify:CR=1 FL=1
MKKDEFLDRMITAKNGDTVFSTYMCHRLCHAFSGKFSDDSAPIVKLYLSIMKGRNDKLSGLFGAPFKEENQNARLLSLEIFETVVLEEKLYRSL